MARVEPRRVPELVPLEQRRVGVGREQADGRGDRAAPVGRVPGRAAAAGARRAPLQRRARVGGARARAARPARARHTPRVRAPAALRARARRRDCRGMLLSIVHLYFNDGNILHYMYDALLILIPYGQNVFVNQNSLCCPQCNETLVLRIISQLYL